MEYAICFLPNIPLRRTPEDGGEMMTELLFGDACQVYEYTGTWARIKNKVDNYEEWLTTKMLTFVSEKEYRSYDPTVLPVLSAYCAQALNDQGTHTASPIDAACFVSLRSLLCRSTKQAT